MKKKIQQEQVTFDKMMMMSAVYKNNTLSFDFYSDSSLILQSTWVDMSLL